jgi:predicted Zn-dependent peptidase
MYELTTLENGLRLLTVRMSHVQSASMGFFMNVGSRYESEELSGASHFIEHMVFKGTERHPTAWDIANAIEGQGGMFNASTGLEATLFWAKVAAPYLYDTLDVLCDMLLHATFDPLEMEKERAVITEEINYSLDAPDSLVQLLANQLHWPDHPLGRDVAGSRNSVAAMSRESLLDFMVTHYQPGQTILGLAGQVNHEEVIDWAESTLAKWEPSPLQPWEPAPAEQPGPKLQVASKDTEQAHISVSFSAMSRRDPNRWILRLLNVILGEGMRSRLFQEVRERLGLAYSVDSFVSMFHDTGTIGIYAGVGFDRVEEALRALTDQLDRMRQEPVPVEELEAAKAFVRGRLALSLEDSFSVASWYTRQMLLGPEVLNPDEVIERLNAVQPSDIQAVAQALFQEQRLNLAIVGPFADGDDGFRNAIRF